MATNSMATCFCMGKAPDCTCDGRCRCECTCSIDKLGIFEPPFPELDWMTEVKDPDLVTKGQKELHKTKDDKGAVGQVIAKDKKHKQPPNCS